MGKQLSLGLLETAAANKDPVQLPKQPERKPEKFKVHPRGRALKLGQTVTLVHRTGRVKQVIFSGVYGPRVHVSWPIANQTLEVSIRTGRVVNPRKLKEWRLETNALAAARKHKAFRDEAGGDAEGEDETPR